MIGLWLCQDCIVKMDQQDPRANGGNIRRPAGGNIRRPAYGLRIKRGSQGGKVSHSQSISWSNQERTESQKLL